MNEVMKKALELLKDEDFMKSCVDSFVEKEKAQYGNAKQKLFEVLDKIGKVGIVDCDSFDYKTDMFVKNDIELNHKDFSNVFHAIYSYASSKKKYQVDKECMFENYEFFVEFNNKIYYGFIMYGQGSYYLLRPLEDTENPNENIVVPIKKIQKFIDTQLKNLNKKVE